MSQPIDPVVSSTIITSALPIDIDAVQFDRINIELKPKIFISVILRSVEAVPTIVLPLSGVDGTNEVLLTSPTFAKLTLKYSPATFFAAVSRPLVVTDRRPASTAASHAFCSRFCVM